MSNGSTTTVSPPQPSPPQHFIAGQFTPSQSGAEFEVVNPATEELTIMAARGQAADINLAVKAAKDAFDDGASSRAKPEFRRKILFKAADLMEARAEEIIKLQSLEMGAPIGPDHAGVHPMVNRSAWNFRFFAEEQELAGNHAFNRDDSLMTYTMSDPAGVFGLITPWNGPFMLST
jgi:5-carboxymethyl-2-hydroxymuconic-semialdehyde dehydrogenase